MTIMPNETLELAVLASQSFKVAGSNKAEKRGRTNSVMCGDVGTYGYLSKFRENIHPRIPIPSVAVGIYNIMDIMFIAGIANSPKFLAKTNINPTIPINAPRLLSVSPINILEPLRNATLTV